MGRIYVFSPNESDNDYSTMGLVGPLLADDCTFKETGNGDSIVTLTHPLDDIGRYRALERDNILKVPVPVRTTPEIQNGSVVTTVWTYRVKNLDLLTNKAQRTLFKKATGSGSMHIMNAGEQVTVVEKPAGDNVRWKVKTDYGTGWMNQGGLDLVTEHVIEDNANSIEEVQSPWTITPQLFRIFSVTKSIDRIQVQARHISYDLMYNNTTYKSDTAASLNDAATGILESCDKEHPFHVYTNVANEQAGLDYTNKNPIDAFLDPEEGICKRYEVSLVRDNYDLYLLHDPGLNRGVVVRYGKNMTGIDYEESDDEVVTSIIPVGETKDGKPLYLEDGVGTLSQSLQRGDRGDDVRTMQSLLVKAGYSVGSTGVDGIFGSRTENGVRTFEQANNLTVDGIFTQEDYAVLLTLLGITGSGKCIDSPNASSGMYPVPHVYVLKCENCKVGDKDGDGGTITAEIARARMREQALKMFEEGCDNPSVKMTVEFQNLGYTEEYAQFRNLENCFLFDYIIVQHQKHNINVTARIVEIEWDVIREIMKGVTIGQVGKTMANSGVTTWQIPAGFSGSKIAGGTVGSGQLGSDIISARHIQSNTINVQHLVANEISAFVVNAVTARIEELIAGHIYTDELYASLATIAVAEITTANIQNANIDWAQITSLTAKIAEIGKAQITTANIIDANITWADILALNADIATIADARISNASITTAQISDLRAQIANVITLAAQDGRFDFAKVSDLVASAMILEEGIAGTVYIKNLVATHANFVGAIIGELVLKSTDDKYYEVEVQSDGTIRTNEVTVSAAEIAAGETTDGRGIVATTANVASMNAENIKADSAIIGSIFTSALTADKISASEAFLASATIPEIRTTAIQALGDSMDLSANASIRLMVGNINVGGTNLLERTQDFSGDDWQRATGYGWYSDGEYQGCVVKSKGTPWAPLMQKVSVEAGAYYTFSCWIRAYEEGVPIRSYFTNATDNTWCTVDPAYAGNNTGDKQLGTVGNRWERKAFTVYVTAGGYACPIIQSAADGKKWSVCGYKLERGNKATDWSPNPNDIYTYTNAQIQLLNDSISAKASQTSVDGLTTRMETAEGKITPTAIVNTVRSSTQYQTDLGGKVDTSTLANYSTTSQTAQEISAAVRAVSVGGTNLFTGTQLFNDNGQWTRLAGWTITPTTYNGCTVAQKTIAWNCMSQKVTVEAGETYTYSAWVKASSTQRMQWLFYRSETAGHCTVDGNNTGTDVVVGTTWQRVSFTKTVATGGIAEPGIDVQNSGVTWYICGIKFERGNKATDWCAAEGEFFAGSTARMTADGFFFGGNQFEIDVPGDENFHLDFEGGSMKNFSADTVRADNLAYSWTGGTYVQIGPGQTYETLDEFARAINNKVLPAKDSISVVLRANQTGTIYLGGMSGIGGVIIYGNGYSFNGSLTIAGTSCYMWIEGLTVSGDLTLNRCRYVRLDNIMFNSSALTMMNGTTCLARKCQWANTNTCFSMSYSRLIAWKCRGGNSNGNAIWGVGAIVQWDTATTDSSPWQSGESSNMRPLGNVNLTASLTVPANILTSVTPTSLNGTTPTPPSSITTTTFNCKASRTAYDAGSPKWYNAVGDVPQARLRQGFLNMGSSGSNEQYGCMWFDTSALSGKTVKSALLTLTRIAGYGRSSEVSVRLYTTPLTSASGNPLTSSVDQGVLGTIGNGETKQFSIPTAAISASANKGFMLRVDDGALISGRGYSDNYAHFYGYGESNAPVLTVTYQ